jgi:uncharacterized membrane protein YjfL (UPF0719 family)
MISFLFGLDALVRIGNFSAVSGLSIKIYLSSDTRKSATLVYLFSWGLIIPDLIILFVWVVVKFLMNEKKLIFG